MFVITSTYLKSKEVVEKYVAEHREYLDECYRKGQLLASGRKATGDGGVILAKASTKAEVDEILRKDPFTREGISKYEIVEFTPTKVAEGLEGLK